jgi:hypothetical protein
MKGIFAVAILCIGMATPTATEAQTQPVRGVVRGVACKVVCDEPVRSAVSKTVKRSRCAVKAAACRTRGVMQRSRSRFGSILRCW